jgi:acetyl esterase/lipase
MEKAAFRLDADIKYEPVTANGVPAEWITAPGADISRNVLYLHGGGYTIGSIKTHRCLAGWISRAARARVLIIDYRLAPEHPFPAALDDAYAALEAVARDPDVRADRVAVGGMSAGGGLAAALALAARDRGGPALAAQILIYPMLDDRSALRTDLDDERFRLWDVPSNVYGWTSYLAATPGGERVPDGAVPSRAASLAGLPPTWIGVGTLDLFHDECVDYAQRLEASGVRCTLEIAHGAYHGFDEVSPHAAITRRFRASWQTALETALLAP